MRLFPLLLVAFALPVPAAEPEIQRPEAAPQPIGARHALRTIPEACARIEGMFTGQAADPYRFAVVRTRARCQPRARLVDAAQAQPSAETGWVFNDLIRVPNAACPSQKAVVEIWRKPAADARPRLDAQGAARIYLGEAQHAAAADRIGAVPTFAARMTVKGEPCNGRSP